MRISRPEISREENTVVYRTEVESEDGSRDLWFRVDAGFGDLITDTSDAPLVGLLIPAMAAGEDIHLAGTLSERLYYNLSAPYQALLQHIFPALQKIEIRPERLRAEHGRAPGVATGFSGGIDSFCVLADHHYAPDCPESFRLTHLVFNNVGSHGPGEQGKRLFKIRSDRLAPKVERMGLPFVLVDSNLDSFYGEGLTFAKTHTPRSIAVALLLQQGIGRYMYAAAHTLGHTSVGPDSGISRADPICLPLLSTEVQEIMPGGEIYPRVEKSFKIAEIPDSYDTLDVCVQDEDINCSRCRKCTLSMAPLDAAGLLDRYSSQFHVDAYRANRYRLLARALEKPKPGPLRRDIVRYIKGEYGWRFRLLLPLSMWKYRAAKRIRRPLGRLARRILHTLGRERKPPE